MGTITSSKTKKIELAKQTFDDAIELAKKVDRPSLWANVGYAGAELTRVQQLKG